MKTCHNFLLNIVKNVDKTISIELNLFIKRKKTIIRFNSVKDN